MSLWGEPKRRNVFKVAVAYLLFTCVSPLLGQTAQNELAIHCDAEPAFSGREDVVSLGRSVSGFIQFREVRDHERWLPTATVYFLGNRERKRAGLMVSVLRQEPGALRVQVIRPGRNTERLLLAELPETVAPIPFNLSFSESGEFSLAFANATTTLELRSFPIEEIVVGCSGSEVDFTLVQSVN